jgi:Holliday junction DNA helicase RuvA
MIAGLRGVVADREADALLVDVNGVIYRVGTSRRTLDEAGPSGSDVSLRTYLVVRQDQLTLYGFSSTVELAVFESMIAVTGVGPRLACAVLSHFDVGALQDAIARGDDALLATVPGIGRKTAARLIVELRGKLPETAFATTPVDQKDREAIEALRALGYTSSEAHAALARVGATEASVEDRILAALRELSR